MLQFFEPIFSNVLNFLLTIVALLLVAGILYLLYIAATEYNPFKKVDRKYLTRYLKRSIINEDYNEAIYITKLLEKKKNQSKIRLPFNYTLKEKTVYIDDYKSLFGVKAKKKRFIVKRWENWEQRFTVKTISQYILFFVIGSAIVVMSIWALQGPLGYRIVRKNEKSLENNLLKNYPGNRLVTIKDKNMQVNEIFYQIWEQTGMQVFYSDEQLSSEKQESPDFKNEPLDKVLAWLTRKSELSWCYQDNNYIICPVSTRSE